MESIIIAQVDHTFDIFLESMVGSTGYGWCLKTIPDGVELISTENIPVRAGVAPVRQIFTFAALKPLKGGLIIFDLLCLYDLSNESADQATFKIDIHDKDENDKLKEQIGGQKFFRGAGAMVHAKPIPPYGFADPGKVHPLYGFPPSLLYGYPAPDCTRSVINSTTNCILKYGNPFGIAAENDVACNLKYGYPLLKYGYPPVYKYGFPLCNSSGETFEVEGVDEKDENCILKYGIPKSEKSGNPGGIAKNDKECIVKYGFPVKK